MTKIHIQTRKSSTPLDLLAAILNQTPVMLASDMEGGKSYTLLGRAPYLLLIHE
jgi:hypothetical protein